MAQFVEEVNGTCVYKKVDKDDEDDDEDVWTCGNMFVSVSEACNGTCPDGRELCGTSACKNVGDDQTKTCGERCINSSTACDGVCPPDLTFLCGGECYPEVNKFFYKECGGLCVDKSAPCDGQCPDGQFVCNGECIDDNGLWRVCGDDCID